ncbi:flavodoxin, partial [Faecalibaculum rodentium]
DYPEDYRATVDRYKEETAKHLRPAVTGSVRDMDQYDVLFVGFPNWGGDLPYIVYSFLEQYDLAGKRIVPFCTNGGGGIGQSFILLQDACRTARVMKGFACNGRQAVDQTDALREWLSGLGLLKE